MNPTLTFPARRAARALLVTAIAGAALLAGCGEKKEFGGPVAARVNHDEITVQQVDLILQQQPGLRPEQAQAAGRQVVQRLIDQQLALEQAKAQKLDREPQVRQQLQMAHDEILARAYLEKLGAAAPKPTPQEIRKYYDDKPALFSQRRIYNLQEIAIEAKPDQVASLRERLTGSKNVAEFVDYLKANDFHFAVSQAVRAAEQLPLTSLDAFARMNDGQAMIVPAPNGAQVIVLAGSRSQPVGLEQARPAIERFILNDRRLKLAQDELKSLRAAAKIEVMGPFAAPTAQTQPALPASGAGAAPK
jgi:EpsD family peptidyl-prolyl cis-trans isomerase